MSTEMLHNALRVGNLFSATLFRTGWSTLVWLCADDIEGARDALRQAQKQYPTGVFHMQHYFGLLSRSMIGLYAGEAASAHAYMEEVWPIAERSQNLRIRSVHVRCLQFRLTKLLMMYNILLI